MPLPYETGPTPIEPEAQESQAKQTLVDSILQDRQLIVASNRGPVTFTEHSDGHFSARQGQGGLVTAVSAVLRDRQAT